MCVSSSFHFILQKKSKSWKRQWSLDQGVWDSSVKKYINQPNYMNDFAVSNELFLVLGLLKHKKNNIQIENICYLTQRYVWIEMHRLI